jgi:type IV fimbrial biogenesis protein FimT
MNLAAPPDAGHTLTELMAILGIAAILAAAAVPLFSTLLLDSRMNATVATAMHAVNLARQFSATRGETIRLCGSADERQCSGTVDWSVGLLLADDAGGFRRSLGLADSSGAPRLRSNRAMLSFEAGSGFATPATFVVCDRRGASAARAVIVSRSGRPRVSLRDGSDRALTC